MAGGCPGPVSDTRYNMPYPCPRVSRDLDLPTSSPANGLTKPLTPWISGGEGQAGLRDGVAWRPPGRTDTPVKTREVMEVLN